jgi:hypothetical protein
VGEFAAFMLIVFVFGWGSAFLLPHLRRQKNRLDGPNSADSELMARLLEDNEQLEARIAVLEEETGFFQQLYPGGDPEKLPPPEDEEREG